MANLATINDNILADSGIDPINLIVGTGTVNYIPKFTAEGSIGNSIMTESGANILISSNIVLHAGNYNNYAPTLTGGGASGTWGINISGNAATATNANNADTVDGLHASAFALAGGSNATGTWPISVTGTSGYANSAGSAGLVNGTSGGAIQSWDIRTIAPSNMTAGRLGFGFTSWANNNSAPYADYLHLRSYTDASGGNDNLVMFLKSGIGMRIYQQAWGSSAPYVTYVDVLDSGNFNAWAPTLTGGGASGTWGISITGNADTLDGYHASDFALASSLSNYLPLAGGTMTGSLSFADNPDNVRIQKGSNHLNLRDPWNNFHLAIYSGGSVYTDSAAYYFRSAAAALWMSIENGNVSAFSSMSAPIFYDSQNTGYYLDPASTSNLYRASFNAINIGDYSQYSFSIPYPGANYGNGRVYMRIQPVQGRIVSFQMKISSTWNWAPAFGYICADVSYYCDGTNLYSPQVTITSATGAALANLAIGDLVIENGYVSIPIYSANSNGISVKIEGSPSFDYSLVSYSSWANVAFPGSNTVNIPGNFNISGTGTMGGNTLATQSWVQSNYVPTSRTLTINGVTYDLSANRSWTIAAGVTSIIAGTGIEVDQNQGDVTISNTGVLSVNGSTGDITGIATTAQLAGYLPLAGGNMTGSIGMGGGTNIAFTGGSHAIYGNNTGYLHFYGYTSVYYDNLIVARGGITNDQGDVTISDSLAVDGNIYFLNSGRYLNVGQQNKIIFSYQTLSTVDAGQDRGGWMWNAYYDWNASAYKFMNSNPQGASMLRITNDVLYYHIKNGPATSDTPFNWDAQYVVLHSGNYNSYAPTLTGGGASGTWGINITGNAATVTNGVYTSRTLTINGVTYDLSANRSWTIAAGVTSILAGAGISVDQNQGDVTISNTGVLSVNGSTGDITGIATTAQLANYLPLTGGTLSGDLTVNARIQLPQNPVGQTYGDGVSIVPPYMFSQVAGDNDGIRIYSEAPSTNNVRMVFELVDDIEAALSDQWVFRNKLTYGSFSARNEFQISGNGDAQARSSMRAPIFYDSTNTAYYVAPSGTSNLLTATILNTYVGNAIYFGGANNYLNWDGARIASNRGIQSDVDMRAPIFYDTDNTAYYGNFAGASRFNITQINAIADQSYVRLVNPEGGFSVNNGPQSGAIKIKLPPAASFTNTMLSFTVKIYNYETGTSRTICVGGYNYFTTDWYNVFAYQIGDNAGGTLTVRFGKDANANCVWIGETNTYWSYPNVFITDIQSGHSQPTNMAYGWSVSIVTSFDTVQTSREAYYQINAGNIASQSVNYATSAGNADTLDGYDSSAFAFTNGSNASGTWGISISGNSATTSQTNFTTLTLNSQGVATQDWVNSQGFATGGPFLALAGGTMSGAINMNGSNINSANAIYSNIFYDAQNTFYYGDFAGTSRFNNLVLGTYYPPSYNGQLILGDTSYNFNFLNGSWASSITAGILANCADEFEFAIHDSGNSVESLFIYSGGRILMGRNIGWGTTYIEAAESFRAPIFYDSNDSSYYVDPNSTSVLYYLQLNAAESMNLYGIRGRFTNEYIHLYNKVGIGNPSGWGAGESATPTYGLSTWGGNNFAYGNNALSTFNGQVNIMGSSMYVTASQLHIGKQSSGTAQMSFESWGSYTGAIAMNASGQFHWGGQGASSWFWKTYCTYNGDYAASGNTVMSLGSSGNLTAYSYQGNGNVDGTGSASYHPSGFYSTATSWLYGTLYMNGNNMRSIGGIVQNDIMGRPNVQWGAGGSATGAVIIKFPGGTGNYGMVHAVIDIYEYNGNNVSTVIVGGHNWGSQWYSYGANVVGYTNKQVRVGVKDGQYCIIIGDGSSTWSYGQVVLRKIQNGSYYSGVMDVGAGYTIGIESDTYSWVSGDLRTFRSSGNMYMNENLVATQSWVSSQGYVTGGPFLPLSGGTVTGTTNFSAGVNFAGQTNWFGGYGPGSGPGIALENLSTFARFAFWGLDFYDWNHGIQMTIDNGYVSAANSFRAPIFYDSNDTTYYLDPNSTSNLWDMRLLNGKWYTVNNNSGNSVDIFVRANADNTYVWRHIYGGSGTGYGTGPGGYGIYNQTLGGDYSAIFSSSGFVTFPYSVRSPIFYDSQDTNYYLDPNSGSVLNQVTTTGRIYSNEWIQFSNYTGLYSPNNNAHFRPNTGSFGPWLVTGTLNGWSGIEFESLSNGNVSLMIATSSNTSGWHNNSYGWQFKWDNGTAFVYKSAYGGGTAATVLDSSNYTSYAPSLTGSGASGTWGINITGNSGYASSAGNADTVDGYHESAFMRYYGYSTSGNFQTLQAIPGRLRFDQVGEIQNWSNAPSGIYTYGGVLSYRGDNFGLQIYASHVGGMVYKTQWNDDQYSGWLRILDAANFNAYAPTLTGGNASGTWGISITGNSNYASTSNYANSSGTAQGLSIVGYGNGTQTFYQTPGTFAGYSGWASYLVSNHGDGATYYNQTIIMPFWGAPQYSRLEGGTFRGPWIFVTTENSPYAYNMNQYVRTTDSPTFTAAISVNADGSTGYVASRIWLYSHNNYRGAGTYMSGTDSTWFAGTPYTNFDGVYMISRRGAAGAPDAADPSYRLWQVSNSGDTFQTGSITAAGGSMTGAFVSNATNQNFTNFTARNTTSAGSMPNQLFYYIEARYNSGSNGTNVYHWVRDSWEYNITNNYSDITFGATNSGSSYSKLLIVSANGHIYATNSFRAPVFYDSADSTYYVDPNGGSYLRGRIDVTGGHYNSSLRVFLRADENGSGSGQSSLQMWVSEPGITWNWAGFGYNVTNDGGSPGGFSRINTNFGQAYMRFSEGGDLVFYNTNTSGTRFTTAQFGNNGTATFYYAVYAPSYFESSDSRLKTVVDEDYRVDAILSIKPKFYQKNGKFEAGYIAQEVQGVYEHAVSLGSDGYLGLSYSQVHTLKIAALEDSVDDIKKKIKELEEKLNTLY